MNKTETDNFKCATCERFTQYYVAASYHNFETAEYGSCAIKQQTVKSEETCENFCRRKYKRLTVEEIDNFIEVANQLKSLLKIK